tara:strand:- start:4380 stop:4790 length:411 start_codon:yes stop_codon:yes gene_type:complete
MKNKKHLDAKGKGEFAYDYKYDILTFKVKDRDYQKSIEFQNFTADIDKKGFVTGARIFDASIVLGVDKYILKNITQWEFKSNVENNVIIITLNFVAKFRNRLLPILGQKQNFMQQFTTPSTSQQLVDSTVKCAVAL